MKLWSALYNVIWLVVLEFVLALAPQLRPWTTYAHVAVGLLIVAATYSNYSALRASPAPGRLQRISRVTFLMSIGMVVLGLPLLFNVGASLVVIPGVSVWDGLIFLHLLLALAIITQMASVATSYDMWEEEEFTTRSAPGEVPARPAPAKVNELRDPS